MTRREATTRRTRIRAVQRGSVRPMRGRRPMLGDWSRLPLLEWRGRDPDHGALTLAGRRAVRERQRRVLSATGAAMAASPQMATPPPCSRGDDQTSYAQAWRSGTRGLRRVRRLRIRGCPRSSGPGGCRGRSGTVASRHWREEGPSVCTSRSAVHRPSGRLAYRPQPTRR